MKALILVGWLLAFSTAVYAGEAGDYVPATTGDSTVTYTDGAGNSSTSVVSV